ncbi:hypothetical protein [Spirillospora sp. NPDC047279]|uniref:hypothetical protein n=1 Tax=Spirillospora sp. NPDC047279 TaxID=3155478 RepID=UPI0033F1283F
MKALLNSMSENELALVRETERARLQDMDEDGLLELHTRIRRARDKHVKLYRREAAGRVEEYGGRGVSRPKNRRNAQKAEVFEDALSRVSRHLAAAARRAAAALKSERLEAARAERHSGPAAPHPEEGTGTLRSQRAVRSPKSPSLRNSLTKQQASSQAAGARRQAKRDNRRP